MIKINNLTKIYKSKKTGDVVALNDISFTLPDTGMVFVIGKSGSGKSTLLNLIGGLDSITSGEINADGIDIKSLDDKGFDKYRSSYLTFVFQDYKLFEGLTVKENVQVGLDITNSYNEKLVLDAIEKVGLKGYEKRYPHQLSGGEQQRVAIARSLVKDSKLILADEPTGNLDARTTKQILDLLKEVSKDRLVVIVSHNLGDADLYADRIIELHEGKINSDKEKDHSYNNQYEVIDNKAYLPHYFDMNEDETNDLLENIKSNKVKEVVQIDNGFKDVNNKEYQERTIELKSKKSTNRSLLKLFKMFLKKKLSSRILTIVFSVLIFVVLSIVQSFVLFTPNPTEAVFEDKYVVMHKGRTEPLGTSMRSAELYNVVDSDIETFLKTGYNDDYYLLSNYGAGANYSLYNISYGLHNSNEWFYFTQSTGTLKCDYDYLVDLFGVDGELKVLAGNLYDKSYGLIITDYLADALIYHDRYVSYENILGKGKYAYVNAIIDTNYEKEFEDIKDLYDTRYSYTNVDEFIQLTYEHPDYERYTQLIFRYYSVCYTFNKNFEEELLEENYFASYYTSAVYSYGDKMLDEESLSSNDKAIYTASSGIHNVDLDRGQMEMNITLYNELFGTAYTNTNYSLEVNNKVTLTLTKQINGEDIIVYEKEFEIVSLGYTIVHDDDFKELVAHQIDDYGVYFKNNEYAKDLISVGNNLGYYYKSVDFDAGLMISKMISAFEPLFIGILVTIYVVLFSYIIASGVNVVKGNKEEIGIYKALGGKFINIGKVLLLDILVTGILIISISLIATPIVLDLANDILVKSFETVLTVKIFHLDVIRTFVDILSINFSTLFAAIILSAIVPALWLFTLKPIQIIKE